MKEKVHVHSWPLDRDFTFNEWCDYLHDRDQRGESKSEVVAEFGGWKFNVNGVCINRRCVVQKFINRSGAKFEVETFQAPAGGSSEILLRGTSRHTIRMGQAVGAQDGER